MRIPALLLLPPLLLACAPDRSVEAPVPTFRAELVATIGTDSGMTSFTSVRSLLFSRTKAELYVVDDREAQVKVFDTTGTFLRLLGRKGAGPGEYDRPYSIAWIHDTLALLDPGNARIGLFDPQGAWLGHLPVQPITGGYDVRLYRTPIPEFWAYGYREVGGEAQSLFIRYTAAGPQDSLPILRRPPSGTTSITCKFPDRTIRFFDAPFAPSDLQIPTTEGYRAIARTDAYRIDILSAAGDTIATIARPESGAPITDEEWERGLARWTTARKETPTAQCDAEGFDRPATKPILGGLFIDGAGAIWVEVKTPDRSRYDLYEPAGSRVGIVNGLPSTGEVDPAIRGALIAIAIPADADGFPRIGIYRLVPETE